MIPPRRQVARGIHAAPQQVESRRTVVVVGHVVFPRPQHLHRNPGGEGGPGGRSLLIDDCRLRFGSINSMLKSLRKKLVARLGPWLAYWTIKILGRTMRFEEIHPEIPKSLQERGIPGIGAFWHGAIKSHNNVRANF